MNGERLVATVAGIGIAVPLDDVQEIIECGTITILPRLPAAMPGVLEWRNAAIPLIDLGAVCGGEPRHDRRNAVIAIAGPHTLALLIDEVEGIHADSEIAADVRLIDPRALLEALA